MAPHRGDAATARAAASVRDPATLLATDDGLPRDVSGAADPHFANVIRIFSRLFPGRRFGGGALSVYIDGVPVVEVWTGWPTGACCPTTTRSPNTGPSSRPTGRATSRSATSCGIDPGCRT